MRIENNKKVRNFRGANVITKVVSFRAEPCVLEMCDKQCAKEKIGRSELIVRALVEYCRK